MNQPVRTTARRTASVLAALTLTAVAAPWAGAAALPGPASHAPGTAAVSAPSRPCVSTADAVQHWSSQGAELPACVLELRRQARVVLGVVPDSGSAGTWVCPTTADAAEAWIRSQGVGACRR
jgi:hypothetical protein